LTHWLVIANETVAGRSLVETLEAQAGPDDLITVLCPITEPREGYVVYEDTRRSSAGRRLEKALQELRAAGLTAHGLVVENEPVDAVRDALATLEPRPDEIVVSTHPVERSGWQRRHVVERIEKVARGLPVVHVVAQASPDDEKNVLVVANETLLGAPLLDAIRERATRGPASFLIVAPQSDPTVQAHPDAERRLKRALAELRGEGIDAHGQVAHPDPYAAAMHAARDERVDEIIVSTFPGARGSSWLRRGVVERLRKDTGLPVEHVVVERIEALSA
jgi:predicted deacetylase